jgi:putative FmdB family regulatory protein
MPTYDYKCPDCGHEFEAFQSMSASPLKECPECGSRKVKRLIGAGGGLIFKGSGFYNTDYKGKASKPAAETAPTPKT